MDRKTVALVLFTFLAWAFTSFVDKLAADRVGTQGALWHALGLLPPVVIYSLHAFRVPALLQADRPGIGLAVLTGIMGGCGSIGFYALLARAEASRMIPLVGLYPAMAAVLALVFLRESVTPAKIAGILLSVVAIYLLSS
ncbi:MAG: DMT family transporter [Chloroflexi bacterium]|nr:DMT family transporter [Chloroflexota bacterium]